MILIVIGVCLVAAFFGVAVIRLGFQGFSPDGIRFTSSRSLKGTTGNVVGIIVIILGVNTLMGGVTGIVAVFWSAAAQEQVVREIQAQKKADEESAPERHRKRLTREIRSSLGLTPIPMAEEFYARAILNADLALHQGQSQEARQFLSDTALEHRGWEYRYLDKLVNQDQPVIGKLHGHDDIVNCVAYSQDGQWIVTGSSDKTIILWDANSFQMIRSFVGHTLPVRCVAFSPDGNTIAAGAAGEYGNGELKYWDVESGRETTLESPEGAVYSVLFSADGKQLVSTTWSWLGNTGEGQSPGIHVWDVESGAHLRSFGDQKARVRSLEFSPDGMKLLGSNSDDNDTTLHVWDFESGQVQLSRTLDHWATGSVAFSPVGDLMASGSRGKVTVWNAKTGDEEFSLPGPDGSINNLMFSPDGAFLVGLGRRESASYSSGEILFWDLKQLKLTRTLKGRVGSFSEIAFRPDGQRIVSVGVARRFNEMERRIFKVESMEKDWDNFNFFDIHSDQDESELIDLTIWKTDFRDTIFAFRGHDDKINSLAFNQIGDRFATGSDDKSVKIWELNSGHEVTSLSGHEFGVTCVAFSPDGKHVVSGSEDGYGDNAEGELIVWDLESGQQAIEVSSLVGPIYDVAFANDGRSVVSAGGQDEKGELKIWDLATGEQLLSLEGHTEPVRSVAVSPDGTILASGGEDGIIRLWDLPDGQPGQTLVASEYGDVQSLCFSPDGESLVSRDGSQLIVWKTKTWTKQRVISFEHLSLDNEVVFSPDGTRIIEATGSSESGAISFYEPKTGQHLITLSDASREVNAIAFDPTGRWLVGATGNEGRIRIWDSKVE